MGNFIAILKVIIALLPLLGQLIQAVESAMPASGQGAAKLAMVREMLQKAYETMGTAQVSFASVWPMLEPVIASLVTMYKNSGIFTDPKVGSSTTAPN